MKLIILDRDGVINVDRPDFVKSPAEWQPIAGSLEAIVRLKQAGFRVVVASNQSGLARGVFDYQALFAIHDKMTRLLGELGAQLDGIFFCPHSDEQRCHCRKPAIGLLEDIARRLGRSIRGCPMIGDRMSDMQAAQAAHARPILVRSGAPIEPGKQLASAIAVYPNLADAADALISQATAASQP